jgi:putative nucleotidyltransferase with HDIG domain
MQISTNFNTRYDFQTETPGYRDPETERHAHRVTTLTLHLARNLGVIERDLAVMQRGALLHDIGMLNVPKHILLKPGLLADDEWRLVRQHPVHALKMLEAINRRHPSMIDIPYGHHERWDGKGYPQGLQGEQIPLAARIFAVADVWDSLTTDRPYRPAWTWREAAEYIDDQAGRQFDPLVVHMFQKGRPAMRP